MKKKTPIYILIKTNPADSIVYENDWDSALKSLHLDFSLKRDR